MKYLLITLICLPFLVSAQKIEQKFSGIENINLTTGSGDIEIKKSPNSEVTMILEHDFGSDYKPSVDQRGNRLVIKDGKHDNRNGDQKYTLIVPDNTDFHFTTGSGNISATGLTIDMKGNSGSGNFVFSGIKGDVSLNTGSGDMDVKDFDGELSVNVGSGDTEIENYKGDLAINCGSGDIEVDGIEGIVRVNAGSGSIELEKAVLTGKSSMNAGSGNVTVTLDAALTADLSMNAGSGDARLDMNGHAFDGTIVLETDKRKGKIEADFDFDKTEEIDENNQVRIRKTAVMGNSDVTVKINTGSGTASAGQ